MSRVLRRRFSLDEQDRVARDPERPEKQAKDIESAIAWANGRALRTGFRQSVRPRMSLFGGVLHYYVQMTDEPLPR